MGKQEGAFRCDAQTAQRAVAPLGLPNLGLEFVSPASRGATMEISQTRSVWSSPEQFSVLKGRRIQPGAISAVPQDDLNSVVVTSH